MNSQKDVVAPHYIEPCTSEVQAMGTQSMEVQAECDGGGGSTPEPAPEMPASMTYTPYSESPTIRVSWRAAPGATYYELHRTSGGAWSYLYGGSATSTSVTLPEPGVFQFRVRACNSGGCSAFRTDQTMRYSPAPNRSDPPDGRYVTFSNDGPTYDQKPRLGMGYDKLRQELTYNSCIDSDPTKVFIEKTPSTAKDYRFSYVRTRSALADELQISTDLSVSARYGRLNVQYEGKKGLYALATRVEETHMLVVSLYDKVYEESITNPGMVTLSEDYKTRARQNPSEYRNFCGDAFVSSIGYGRRAFLTFQLTSLKHSRTEIQTATANLKADVENFADAKYDEAKRQEIVNRYASFEVVSRVVSSTLTYMQPNLHLADALKYIHDFQAEDLTNPMPVNIHVVNYPRPTDVPNFPDYTLHIGKLKSWYRMDADVARRCALFDETLSDEAVFQMSQDAKKFDSDLASLDLHSACHRVKQRIMESIDACERTEKWSQCQSPYDTTICYVDNQRCDTYASRFPIWLSNEATLHLSLRVGSNAGSYNYLENDYACLENRSMVDRRIKGSVDCAGQSGCPTPRTGVTVKTYTLRNARSPSNDWDGDRCLYAEVWLRTESWWGAGAEVNQYQTVTGLYPLKSPVLF